MTIVTIDYVNELLDKIHSLRSQIDYLQSVIPEKDCEIADLQSQLVDSRKKCDEHAGEMWMWRRSAEDLQSRLISEQSNAYKTG